MSRILIEFFGEEYAENVAPFLYGDYDRVIYFSFEGEGPGGRAREVIESLLPGKFGVQVYFLTVAEKTLNGAYRAIYELMREEDEYVFDLTGGSQIFSAAVGIFVCGSAGNISVVSEDPADGIQYLQFPEYKTVSPVKTFGVDELISLSGGLVVSSSVTYSEIKSKSTARAEIMRMWNCVSGIPADWNRFCSMNNARQDRHVKRRLTRADDKKTVERVVSVLRTRGIVKNDRVYVDEKGRTYLEYDLLPRAGIIEMYEKAGTALELYTCLAAGECGSFSDVRSGVVLDLDGLITKKRGDPKNEIDVTAVYKNRPVLISCKNCKPTKEHLYEILTMAEQYGGKYAVPVLVCSERAFEPVSVRAAEMGVILIDSVAEAPLKRLKDVLVKNFPV